MHYVVCIYTVSHIQYTFMSAITLPNTGQTTPCLKSWTGKLGESSQPIYEIFSPL